jgi:hypothetical protein
MARRRIPGLFVVVTWLTAAIAVPAAAQVPISGTWIINKRLSEFPRQAGFGMDLVPAGAGGEAADSPLGGGSGAPVLSPSRETEADARNTRQLVDEVKSPPSWFSIVQTSSFVRFTDASGRTRTFQTNGKDEVQRLEAGPVPTVARWEGDRLVIRYKVSRGRELRYTFSRSIDSPQLNVEVRFVERGGLDALTRVYDPLPPGAPLPPPDPPAPATAARTDAGAARAPASPQAPATPRDVPATREGGDAPLGTQKADAELSGITRIGVVVEELTTQAAACGLDKAAIESAVSKCLTDAGMKVARNSDEDTYLYVDIITASVSNGLCVSRYDASLYTHTTARLSYQSASVLVRVALLHEGGIAGGGPKEHADRVMGNLVQHVGQFGERIRAAGK